MRSTEPSRLGIAKALYERSHAALGTPRASRPSVSSPGLKPWSGAHQGIPRAKARGSPDGGLGSLLRSRIVVGPASYGSRARLSRIPPLEGGSESILLRRSLCRNPRTLDRLKPVRVLGLLELAVLSGGPRPGQDPPPLARAKALAREAAPDDLRLLSRDARAPGLKPGCLGPAKAGPSLHSDARPEAHERERSWASGAAYASAGQGRNLEGSDPLPARCWHRCQLKLASSIDGR